MGLFSSSKKEKVIDWIPMVRADQLEEFKETSHQSQFFYLNTVQGAQ